MQNAPDLERCLSTCTPIMNNMKPHQCQRLVQQCNPLHGKL